MKKSSVVKFTTIAETTEKLELMRTICRGVNMMFNAFSCIFQLSLHCYIFQTTYSRLADQVVTSKP